MSKCMRTVLLKLYKPGKWKREVMDEAMRNYSRAFQYLLDFSEKDIDNIKDNYKDFRGKYNSNSVVKWIDKEIDKNLNEYNIEPFKDSIKIDFAGVISLYLNHVITGKRISFPVVYKSSEEVSKNYEKLLETKSFDFNKVSIQASRLFAKEEKLMPIFFCRSAINRNFSLLYDEENDRYFAKLYLMNATNELRKLPENKNSNTLNYLNDSTISFSERGGKRSFLMFPLSFGSFQENYIKEAFESPGIIKTARLIKKKNEYFLAVNIVKDRPKVLNSENFMGISRGIDNAVNYTIVNSVGKNIAEGFYKIEEKDKIANNLTQVALKYKALVIMEKLVDRGDQLKWQEKDGKKFLPIMDCLEYNKLVNVLRYKLPDKGLPNLIRVSSRDIFYCCPKCGVSSKTNRFSNKILICTTCGTTMDVEKAGSLNLAKKIIRYNSDTIKIRVEHTEKGIRFVNKEIGLIFYPENPLDCADQFMQAVDIVIANFYKNIDKEIRNKTFKKKYSLIKKIEANRQEGIFELVSAS